MIVLILIVMAQRHIRILTDSFRKKAYICVLELDN